ncbi:glycerol kinase [Salvia divinorum]|uniref:glycerol kinase n=1 Tax=Salvia divinorum TaxID=28513 RepID=A0ABD1I7X9_SALDI
MSEEEVFIGSIDQGTTSTRFIIYDRSAKSVGSHQVEFTQFYPQSGWLEHDPMEILESVRWIESNWLDQSERDICSLEQFLWFAFYNAIVWMDARTSSICRKLENELSGGRTRFVEQCGLPISTYFSALKLLWLLENVNSVKAAVKKGDALFGTVDTWLIWNLTGGKQGGLHITDVSNASRTMLMNLKTLEWDETILKTLGIPIAGCLGDQHAAMVGQACRKAQTNYALEGSIAIAGAAVQWLRDSLGIIKSAGEIEELAMQVDSSGGVYFVPAFNGLFVPWWRDDHIARAVLESMCFQVKDVLDSMHKDAGEKGEV